MTLLIPILVILGIVEFLVRGVFVFPLAFMVFMDNRNVAKFIDEFMNPYAMRLTTHIVAGKSRGKVDPAYVAYLEERVGMNG